MNTVKKSVKKSVRKNVRVARVSATPAKATKAAAKHVPAKKGPASEAWMIAPRHNFKGKGFVGYVKGGVMQITVDLNHNFGPSESGKSLLIAQSDRFQELPGRDVTTWLNFTIAEKKVS